MFLSASLQSTERLRNLTNRTTIGMNQNMFRTFLFLTFLIKWIEFENCEIIQSDFHSDFGSFANLVKSAAGTGLFAIPNAFACVGMVLGIVGTVVMGILITVSLQLLIRTHYAMCKRNKSPFLNYDKLVIVTLTSGALKGRISPEFITYVYFDKQH